MIPINAIDELEQFEKMNKKSKVLSCIALTKARINHDVEYINEFAEKINQALKIKDGKNKIISMCLVSCYSKINQEKAIEIISAIHNKEELDPTTQEHIDLLGLDDGADPSGSITQESYARDFAEINSILRELNQENDNIKPDKSAKTENSQRQPKQDITNPNNHNEEAVSSFAIISRNFFALCSYLVHQSDYIIIGFFIVFLYVCLSLLKSLCSKKKTKGNNKKE